MNRICITAIFVCYNLFSFLLFGQAEYLIESQSVVSGGENAPFWLVSNRQGLSSLEKNNTYMRTGIFHDLMQDKKWNFGYGLDLVGAANYNSNFILHQAYVDLKYRKLQLTIGSKEISGILKNSRLSSGGMSWSGNAAPIPQLKIGLPEFVSFSWLMKNRLKIKGDLSYGWFTDGDYQRENARIPAYWDDNRYYNTDVRYHHKALLLQYDFKSSPWSMILGLESETQFGGKRYSYHEEANAIVAEKSPASLKHYLMALIPMPGDQQSVGPDQQYMYGNTLGSWHLVLSYHQADYELKGYLENYFDDFSGMSKQNGFDGLWGIEYNKKGQGVTGVVLEYLQTTNQSGPIHWAPDDHAGTVQKKEATGNDDYYNNFFYTGWSNYGMACGNPLLTSPVYNKDGILRFENNRVKAFHLGANAQMIQQWSVRLLATYSRGWGRHYFPFTEVKSSLSTLLEVNYSPVKGRGWQFSLSGSSDHGSLYGDNQGLCLKIGKRGVLFGE